MVQFISHYNERYSYLDSIQLAIKGGCKWIQLRMKDVTCDEIRPVAVEVLKYCRKAGAVFIIDDYVELAKEVGADGVHLGKNDMPVRQARDILGNNAIIGGTANNFEDVRKLYDDGVNYIGCGPFRFTETKRGLSPILGCSGIRNIIDSMRNEHLNLPIVAIGGIRADDIPQIMNCGVSGIAVSGSVLNADDPVEEMRRIIHVTSSYSLNKREK